MRLLRPNRAAQDSLGNSLKGNGFYVASAVCIGIALLLPYSRAQVSAGAKGSRQPIVSQPFLPPQTQTVDPSAHAHKPTLADFAWLEGRWQGAWGPRVAEQTWTAPKAGQMLGLFRAVENDKIIVIELFSLIETTEGVALRFRHFTPALVPWEQSDVTTLKLAGLDAKTAIFENNSGGQPSRDVFTRIDADTYALKSGFTEDSAGPHETEIRYHRQK